MPSRPQDVQFLTFATQAWKESQDHSKARTARLARALTTTVGSVHHVEPCRACVLRRHQPHDHPGCTHGTNRPCSSFQFTRGGGAACIEDEGLWSQMNKAITAHNSC